MVTWGERRVLVEVSRPAGNDFLFSTLLVLARLSVNTRDCLPPLTPDTGKM